MASFLSSRIPFELPYDIYLLCLINLLLAVTFSDFSCFWRSWQFWGVHWLTILGNVPCWDLSDIFPMIRLGFRVLGRKTTHTVNMTFHCWCWPWSPGWNSSSQVLFLRSYSFLPSILYLWEGSHHAQPTLEWGIELCFLKSEISA